MSQIKTECILWIPNPMQDPPAISYASDGKVIVPSRVDFVDWANVGIRRSELPRVGTIETACRVINTGNTNIAWPTIETVTFEAPGFNQPLEIFWKDYGCIASSIIFPGFNRNVAILPGRNSMFNELCPNQQAAKPWEKVPAAGTATYCYIGYYKGTKGIIGYAWPEKSEHLNRVFHLPRGLLLVDPTDAEMNLRVTVLEKKGEMQIIIRS